MNTGRRKGFTLIELLIAVAVVAILAAIAYPSYQAAVQKARRSDARSALLAAAQAMERYYTENQKYTSATLGPTGVYPAASPDGFYNLEFSDGPSAAAYSLQASPSGAQASDACGNFTLTHTGVKDVNGGTLTAQACDWEQ